MNTTNTSADSIDISDGSDRRAPRQQPVWRSLVEPAAVADALIDLYEHKGQSRYDEVVTQLEHALQTASHAMAGRASESLIIASLLHDIGHLLMNEHDENGDFLVVDRVHEEIGSRFLSNWFGIDVTGPIALHVPAKRYLCAVDEGYHDGLSAASVRSLEVQGGAFTRSEAEAFEQLRGAMDSVELRRWDDLGKAPGAPTPSLSVFRDLIVEYLGRRAEPDPSIAVG